MHTSLPTYQCLCVPVLIQFMSLAGLRKLEAFFGFLITVMALSFGYEVRDCHSFQYISSVC